MSDHYHFHKDCKYYPECTEELVRNQGHEVIKFTCPVGGVGHYYKGDLHTIKWECGAFEPYQEELTFTEYEGQPNQYDNMTGAMNI